MYFLDIIRRFINWFYRCFIWRNKSIRFDYTAKVVGIDSVKILGMVTSGRFFWLEAVEKYGKQRFNPQIVFKGIFHASDSCHIGATHYVEIGNNVLFGSKVYISDHGHGTYSGLCVHSSPEEPPTERKLDSDKEVIIGDNVWVGDNVTILPNVHIGNGCVIGSNSVVTKDIPDNCIAVGIPARVIKKYDFEKKKWVKFEFNN